MQVGVLRCLPDCSPQVTSLIPIDHLLYGSMKQYMASLQTIVAHYTPVAVCPCLCCTSRWGYKTLSDVKQVVEGYKEANIPLEVMWADIDYMDRYRDFTFDPQRFNQQELRAFVDRCVAGLASLLTCDECAQQSTYRV